VSNLWDLYCRTCNDDCGIRWNHGDDRLAEIWKYRDAFARLHGLGRVVEFRAEVFGPESMGDLIVFAFHHVDHDVVPRDEYGRFLDECGERIRVDLGPGDWRWEFCRRPSGHEGQDHSLFPESRPLESLPVTLSQYEKAKIAAAAKCHELAAADRESLDWSLTTGRADGEWRRSLRRSIDSLEAAAVAIMALKERE
jgi:hypothetical protein